MVLKQKSSSLQSEQNELINQQARMDRELRVKTGVSELPFNKNALQFSIPSFEGAFYKARSVSIDEECSADVKLIFSALNRANYIVFFENKGTETHKKQTHAIFGSFVSFLCSTQVKNIERAKILKMYEAHRVNKDGVKPQSSGLRFLISMIRMAIEDENFKQDLSEYEYTFLYNLTKTKAAPFAEADSLNLAQWISDHSWLRRDDVGIGHKLYARLASPKATIKSFSATIEVAMLETLKAKEALMALFETQAIKPSQLPLELPRSEFSSKSKHDVHVRKCFLEAFDVLRQAYHSIENPSEDLTLAVKMILSENIRENDLARYDEAFFENRPGFNSTSIVSSRNKLFFSIFFLRELAEYVENKNDESAVVPACQGEHLLFHWIMATQTVQASDIPKLSRSNFRFIKRRSGRVSHIQIGYFKGRSKTVHETKDINTNTVLGSAILLFILQRTPRNGQSVKLSEPLKTVAVGVSFGRFINLLNTDLKDKIHAQLDKEKASSVFLDSVTKLLEHGITKKGKYKTIEEFWQNCETPCKPHLFKPSSIKTAAVYASSDKFNPTQLTNFHSHTDRTERESYLTPNNEEWLNNTGLITRTVMQDLTVNLFRASQTQKQFFNSQFTHATEYISAKSEETLARLKLITGKDNGKVDDLGVMKGYRENEEPSDTIYLVDSAETVLKLRHFLSEVKKKHHILAKSAPDFLLLNVLPTVEWIETLFQYKRFTTLEQGDELYQKYSAVLPPLFDGYMR